MKNREFYREQIMKARNCDEFVKPIIQKEMGFNCNGISCVVCQLKQAIWLDDEYVEPKPQLTDKEKEWLRGLIEVFKPIKICDILKSKNESEEQAFLKLYLNKDGILFTPTFNENEMYLGLEPNKPRQFAYCNFLYDYVKVHNTLWAYDNTGYEICDANFPNLDDIPYCDEVLKNVKEFKKWLIRMNKENE